MSSAGGTRAYRYDLDGDRVYKSDPTRTVSYVFDRTDQLVSETNGTTTNAVYDAFGNQTKKPEDDLSQTTLAYDAANRLTSVSPSTGSAATFTFDALSRNKTRVVGSNTDSYGYLGASETVYEVATTGGTTRTIDAALGPDGSRLALKDATGFGWTLFDLHGDFIALENQAMSAVTDALRYDGYGMTIDADGAFGSPWKYQGALDVAPNAQPLYDLGARNYAPSLGALTSLDSVLGNAADPLSMNRFLYAESNPTTFIDPDGHATLYCNTETSDTCHPTQSRTGRKMASTIHRYAEARSRYRWSQAQSLRARARNADRRVVHFHRLGRDSRAPFPWSAQKQSPRARDTAVGGGEGPPPGGGPVRRGKFGRRGYRLPGNLGGTHRRIPARLGRERPGPGSIRDARTRDGGQLRKGCHRTVGCAKHAGGCLQLPKPEWPTRRP
jgi:RHS repeat-associated protein